MSSARKRSAIQKHRDEVQRAHVAQGTVENHTTVVRALAERRVRRINQNARAA